MSSIFGKKMEEDPPHEENILTFQQGGLPTTTMIIQIYHISKNEDSLLIENFIQTAYKTSTQQATERIKEHFPDITDEENFLLDRLISGHFTDLILKRDYKEGNFIFFIKLSNEFQELDRNTIEYIGDPKVGKIAVFKGNKIKTMNVSDFTTVANILQHIGNK